MEQSKFKLSLAALAGLVVLSTTPLGAVFGLVIAMAVALIVGPLVWIVATAFGIDMDVLVPAALIAAGLGALGWIVLLITRLREAQGRGDADAVRLNIAALAATAAVPISLWLSTMALTDAWPT